MIVSLNINLQDETLDISDAALWGRTDDNMSSFGQILKEIGEFGLFQKLLVAALSIPTIFAGFDLIVQAFTGVGFPHHCNTDWILDQGPNLTVERQINLTIPVNKDGKYESCEMFTPVDWDLEKIEAFGINTTTGCINGLDYETPEGASSIMADVRETCLHSRTKQYILLVRINLE